MKSNTNSVLAVALVLAMALTSSVAWAGPSAEDCDITGIYPSLSATGGFFARLNLTSNQKLHGTLTPTTHAVGDFDDNGTDDIIASFTGFGTFKMMNGNYMVWNAVTTAEADWFSVGDLDDNGSDDVIIVFSSPAGTWKYMNNSALSKINPNSAVRGSTADVDGDGTDEGLLVFTGAVSGTWLWDEPGNSFAKFHAAEAQLVVGTGDVDGSADGRENAVIVFASPSGTYVWDDVHPNWNLITPLSATVATDGAVVVDDTADKVVIAANETYLGSPVEGTWILTDYAALTFENIHPNDAFTMQTCDFDGDGTDDIAMSWSTFDGMWAYLNNVNYSRQTAPSSSQVDVGYLDGH